MTVGRGFLANRWKLFGLWDNVHMLYFKVKDVKVIAVAFSIIRCIERGDMMYKEGIIVCYLIVRFWLTYILWAYSPIT